MTPKDQVTPFESCRRDLTKSLQWRHNGHDGFSNHQPHDCLLNRLFRCRSKLCVTGLCAGNSSVTVNSPHKWPVTRKCFHLMMSSCLVTLRVMTIQCCMCCTYVMKPAVIWAYLNSTREVVLIFLIYIVMYTMLYLVPREGIEHLKREILNVTEQDVCNIHQRAVMVKD